jgi:alkylated DNA repair dioxygenase AlkB
MHAGQVTYSVNRETVHYGQQYMYTDVAKPALPWAPSGPIPILRSLVAQLIGVPLERVDQCSCNRNAAGKGMGLHPGKRNPLVVGSFSFLGVRRMGFCDIGGDHFDDHLPAVVLEPGSLLIFTENFNEKFKHGIRDQAGTGQRISVIFRIFARQS